LGSSRSRWRDLRGSAKENWGKLADADPDEISGKREHLTGKVQTIYGVTRREADNQVWDWGKTVERTQKKIV
jgi:uncharacterized protein YjbJ (UPF0337 family)